MKFGEIWYVKYPYQEDSTQTTKRPAIFIKNTAGGIEALVIKVTKQLKHLGKDKYKVDFILKDWEAANLDKKSLARISNYAVIDKKDFIHKIGELTEEDLETLKINFMKFMINEKK